ncbi:hypothetical protein TIFTF001_029387 [Ficus carica]|uniref:TLC domain-containing protein n=1 Tax=Ficus carica TaxID=3494 RepID=A0AA88DRQ9_FICCA|nr:hypothetical protein TIFTF001_029387 [Ficus carica]
MSSLLLVVPVPVSVGYFIADLGMILWLYPSLGGIEYVIHHSLSGIAVSYSMFSGEGQLYTYMILISEITTPEINIRWYLDIGGMKRSIAYLINGVVIFFAWLVARILMFGYMFYHVYLHYDQVIQMHIFGYLLVMVVPSVLAIMNLMWFGKILKGLKKLIPKSETLASALVSAPVSVPSRLPSVAVESRTGGGRDGRHGVTNWRKAQRSQWSRELEEGVTVAVESRSKVRRDRSRHGVVIRRRILPWSRNQRTISPWIRSLGGKSPESVGNLLENHNRSSSFPSTSNLRPPHYNFSNSSRGPFILSD